MSAGKTLFTFITGVASGLALAYYADPKGSQQKLKKMEKELRKTRKTLDKKITDYKKDYNELVDSYAGKSKEFIEKTKGVVDGAKKSAKAE